MMNKNQEQCKYIADDLEKVATACYFMYDGDLYPIDTVSVPLRGL